MTQHVNFDYSYYAPDIKSHLMNIFLNFGEPPKDPPLPTFNNTFIPEDKLKYSKWNLLTDTETFTKIHRIILLLSFLCIIIMLLPKILINYTLSYDYNTKLTIYRGFRILLIP